MQETLSKPSRGQQLPYFRTTTTGGVTLDLWDIKQKRNLLIAAPANESQQASILRALQEASADLEWLDTTALVIAFSAPRESYVDPLFVTLDESGKLRETLGIPPGASFVLLADRFGAVFQTWDVLDIPDVLSSLRLLHAQCPECGVPEWPDPPFSA